jgi:hypothetical protein
MAADDDTGDQAPIVNVPDDRIANEASASTVEIEAFEMDDEQACAERGQRYRCSSTPAATVGLNLVPAFLAEQQRRC